MVAYINPGTGCWVLIIMDFDLRLERQLTLWPLGDAAVILKVSSPNTCYEWISWVLFTKLLSESRMNATEHLWWYVNTGPDNGLVLSGNQCWPRSIVAIWHHNELTMLRATWLPDVSATKWNQNFLLLWRTSNVDISLWHYEDSAL